MLNLSASRLEVNGIATRLLAAGRGDALVVLVHGAGGRADRWVPTLEALAAAGYRACAPDLPGHGFAAKGPGVACTVPAYRDFLGGLLPVLGAGRVALVGTSLGGHVAAAYAAAQPARVRALVLSGSLGLVPVGGEVRRRVQAGLTDQSPEGVRTKLLRLLGERLVTDALVEEDVTINNSPGARESLSALGEYIAAELDNDVVGAQLATSGVPVLLLRGARDAPAPSIPGARSVVVPDAGHAPYLEKPDDFNRAVIDFLRAAT